MIAKSCDVTRLLKDEAVAVSHVLFDFFGALVKYDASRLFRGFDLAALLK